MTLCHQNVHFLLSKFAPGLGLDLHSWAALFLSWYCCSILNFSTSRILPHSEFLLSQNLAYGYSFIDHRPPLPSPLLFPQCPSSTWALFEFRFLRRKSHCLRSSHFALLWLLWRRESQPSRWSPTYQELWLGQFHIRVCYDEQAVICLCENMYVKKMEVEHKTLDSFYVRI